MKIFSKVNCFILDEVSKNRFYTFQPRGPEPLRFE